MASEYLKWKYRNEKPEERQELTPEEKRKNWWHYHKWHVVIAVVLAGVGINLIWHGLGIGKIKPDYQIAYVGENALPEDTAAAIEGVFASLGEDLNGDGQVTVQLNQHLSAGPGAGMAAGDVTLMADLMDCQSYFFLLEDPAAFQQSYHALRLLDGSLPEEWSGDGTCLPWSGCPALAGAEPEGGDELVSGLFLARRGFWTKDTCQYPEGCDALWDRLTEGAAR